MRASPRDANVPTKINVATPRLSTVGPLKTALHFTPWTRALRILLVMLRNVTASTTFAWTVAFLTSRGNVFSSVPPNQQSYATFLLSCMLMTHTMSCLNNWCVTSMRWRFSRRRLPPGQQQSTWVAFAGRIARGAALHIVLITVVAIAIAVACGSPWYMRHLAPLRLEYYTLAVVDHYGFVVMDLVSRRIHRQESMVALQQDGTPVAISRHHRGPTIRQILRAYLRSTPFILSVLIAGGYVHGTSQWIFSTTNSVENDAFVVASLALKLVVQEIAKHYLQRRNVKQLHVMCVIVSLPTVLIDTQVRVVILGLNNTQSTLARTVGMGLLEIALRFGKVMILRWRIATKVKAVQHVAPGNPAHDRRFGSSASFEQWRTQHVNLHTAETFADMYAEYIAIGCSAAITYFFGNGNVHYRLGHADANANGHAGLAAALLGQVVVEVVADYFACVMEMYLGGMEMTDEVCRLDTFLGFLTLMMAVLNVDMSSVLYLRSG